MITRELSVKLTDEEKQAKGQEVARAVERYDELEQAKKDRTRELGEEMKGIRKTTKKLARQLRQGEELRQVTCTELREERTNTVTLIRDDTKEVIETRAMTIDELQAPLFTLEGGKAKGKAKKAAAASAEQEAE